MMLWSRRPWTEQWRKRESKDSGNRIVRISRKELLSNNTTREAQSRRGGGKRRGIIFESTRQPTSSTSVRKPPSLFCSKNRALGSNSERIHIHEDHSVFISISTKSLPIPISRFSQVSQLSRLLSHLPPVVLQWTTQSPPLAANHPTPLPTTTNIPSYTPCIISFFPPRSPLPLVRPRFSSLSFAAFSSYPPPPTYLPLFPKKASWSIPVLHTLSLFFVFYFTSTRLRTGLSLRRTTEAGPSTHRSFKIFLTLAIVICLYSASFPFLKGIIPRRPSLERLSWERQHITPIFWLLLAYDTAILRQFHPHN